MKITRRSVVTSGLISLVYYFFSIKSVSACSGVWIPNITKISQEHLRNVMFKGYKNYLSYYFPQGYKYSDNIMVKGFTDRNYRKSIDLESGKENKGEIFLSDGVLSLNISLKNISGHCSNIRIIHQDNSGKGPCFEVANYYLSENTFPFVEMRMDVLSGKGASFFVVAEINTGKRYNEILVSNIYPFEMPCGGDTIFEIINA